MELVQVIGQDGGINWVLNNSNGHEQLGGERQTFNFVGEQIPRDPLEPDMIGQQYILLDDNTVVPIQAGLGNITFLSQPPEDDSDDNETPPHVLDHMYAKKPREPGTETVKPPRRRLKKKELLANQLFVHDAVSEYQEAPKINIIRQRLPGGSPVTAAYAYRSPPKILNASRSTPKSTSWSSQSFTPRSDYVPNHSRSKSQVGRSWNSSKHKNQSVLLEESELPHLGAFVTVGGDGNKNSTDNWGVRSQYNNINNNNNTTPSRARKASTEFRIPPAYVEVAIPTGIEGLEDEVEVDDTELFLDFPMEESEEVSTLDVDFNEIPMSTAPTGPGHGDGENLSTCLQIQPTASESNLNSARFQKSMSLNVVPGIDNSHMMGPDSSLVIKEEFRGTTDDLFVHVPQYAPKRRKTSSHSSTDCGNFYLTPSPNPTTTTPSTNSDTRKRGRGGGRGRGRTQPENIPIPAPTPPKSEPPAVPLRISSRSRRVPNRLDDEDVILSPIRRTRR